MASFEERVSELREELVQIAGKLDQVDVDELRRRQRNQVMTSAVFGVVGAAVGGLLAVYSLGSSVYVGAGVGAALGGTGGAVITAFIYEFIIDKDRLVLVEANWVEIKHGYEENISLLTALQRLLSGKKGHPIEYDKELHRAIMKSPNALLNILILGITIETVIKMSLGNRGELVRRLERDLRKLPHSYSDIRDEDIAPKVLDIRGVTLQKLRQEEEKLRHAAVKPVLLRDWSFSGEYSNKGGELRSPHSDVSLEIPQDAIQLKKTVKIKTAVSTDLERAHSKLKLGEEEAIVSPVVELSGGGVKFNKPVLLKLPHFLPPDCPEDEVIVYKYRKDSTGTLRKVKLKMSNDMNRLGTGEFSVANDKHIHVQNDHFCIYVVVHKPKRRKTPEPLRLHLYGRHIQRDTRDVDLWLIVWDRRLDIMDFRKGILPASASGCFIIGKTLEPLTDGAGIQVGTSVNLDGRDSLQWRFNGRSDPKEKRFEITKFFPPKPRGWRGKPADISPEVVRWTLEHGGLCSPSDWFSCDVFVGYIVAGQEPFSFFEPPEKQNLPVIKLKVTQEQEGNRDAPDGATGGTGGGGGEGGGSSGKHTLNINLKKAHTVFAMDVNHK